LKGENLVYLSDFFSFVKYFLSFFRGRPQSFDPPFLLSQNPKNTGFFLKKYRIHPIYFLAPFYENYATGNQFSKGGFYYEVSSM